MKTWIEAQGASYAGDSPIWQCPACGKGIHMYGIKEMDKPLSHKGTCPDCGEKLAYPWEIEGRKAFIPKDA